MVLTTRRFRSCKQDKTAIDLAMHLKQSFKVPTLKLSCGLLKINFFELSYVSPGLVTIAFFEAVSQCKLIREKPSFLMCKPRLLTVQLFFSCHSMGSILRFFWHIYHLTYAMCSLSFKRLSAIRALRRSILARRVNSSFVI